MDWDIEYYLEERLPSRWHKSEVVTFPWVVGRTHKLLTKSVHEPKKRAECLTQYPKRL
jgi:hypothetical protein